MPEQKCAQAMKSPLAILCVLARALKPHGRFSARQNRMCLCQLMVGKYEGAIGEYVRNQLLDDISSALQGVCREAMLQVIQT